MTETITTADIAAAEKLTGVCYTPDERSQMLDNIEAQVLATKAGRKVPLSNSAPMASRFDPRLPGFEMPRGPDRITTSVVTADLPSDAEDIAFAPLTHLSHWIASGQITSRRLTEIYLRRISTLNPKLHCFATVTNDLALAEADAMDTLTRAGKSLGPLHGIPYALKDLFDTKDVVTGWGAEPYQDRIPETDSEVTRKLRAAGAVLLGKSTLGALAYGDLWYGGRTRNPWNLNEGSSGSSAGSASATAAGLCGFSIGTETLGSIVSPSQRCGTTGLRPTFGRVSRHGGMTLSWSMDKVGPICRGVEDTALVLAALNGFDAADLCSIRAPFSFDASYNIEDMVVGYLPEAFGEGANASDHAALEAVRTLGLTVREVSLPDLPYRSLIHILYAEAAAAFEDLTLTDADDTLAWQEDGAWPNTMRKARFLSSVDHVNLDRLRFRVMQEVGQMMDQVDVLVGPATTGPMLVASNFTGHPCLHLRAGFETVASREPGTLGKRTPSGPEAGAGPAFNVPSGISLWGQLFDEGPLLRLGMALERALGVASVRPVFPQ